MTKKKAKEEKEAREGVEPTETGNEEWDVEGEETEGQEGPSEGQEGAGDQPPTFKPDPMKSGQEAPSVQVSGSNPVAVAAEASGTPTNALDDQTEDGKAPELDPNRVVPVNEAIANQRLFETKGDVAPMQPVNDAGQRIGIRSAGDEAESGEQEYIIAAGKVGSFVYGERVRESQFPEGTNIKGLVNRGALSVVDPK